MWYLVFFSTFFAMEWVAWALHKYVMHGFLWSLHEDHHVIRKDRWWQKNDAFAIFFAVPSFLSILFDHIYSLPLLGAWGYGIMAYGFAYFFVHEVIIHRRLKFFKVDNHWYFSAVIKAHRDHHKVRTKEDSSNFGMLICDLAYFREHAKKQQLKNG